MSSDIYLNTCSSSSSFKAPRRAEQAHSRKLKWELLYMFMKSIFVTENQIDVMNKQSKKRIAVYRLSQTKEKLKFN